MRVILPPPDAPPVPTEHRLPRWLWRAGAPVCAALAVVWALNATAVRAVAPSKDRPPLQLAHPKPAPSDWPGWRGANQQGRADEAATPPVQWSPSVPPAWTTELPGDGQSSPCVWGDAVFVTVAGPRSPSVILLKLDRESGRILWQTELTQATASAASTPACDGHLVFVSVVEQGQVCLCAVDFSGALQWKQPAGPYDSPRPYRASPVVHGSLVYVAVDHRGSRLDRWRPSSTLTAFHRRTGEIVWRALRPNGDSEGTPVVATIAGRAQVVLAGRQAITSYDPETGATLWTCRWSAERVTGSVACDDRHVYACARHPDAETLCIAADGDGDVTETHVVWRERRSATDGPSPTVIGPAVVLLGNQGLLTALDRKSGRLLWQRRLPGEFALSPVAVRNRLYCTNRDRVTIVVDCDRRGEVLAENALGQSIAAPLAVSGHRLIVCGERQLLMLTPPARDIYAGELPPRKL
jgi:outer membrane protein assembly factor BamB